MSTVSDSVLDEPVFARPDALPVSDDNGIGGEPALDASSEAAVQRCQTEAWLRRQWAEGASKGQFGAFAGICIVSGLVAVFCALVKGGVGFLSLAVIVGAPVVEEVSKVMCPLMVLEKRPWRFSSAGAIIVACALSGLVFASVENLLYFNFYIPQEKLTTGVVLWRLIVCTSVHVAGTVLSGAGLVRAWQRAAKSRGRFEIVRVWPYVFAAMALHGLYNLGALLYALHGF